MKVPRAGDRLLPDGVRKTWEPGGRLAEWRQRGC